MIEKLLLTSLTSKLSLFSVVLVAQKLGQLGARFSSLFLVVRAFFS